MAQLARNWFGACRRAPELAVAAVLALVIAVACLVNAGAAFLRDTRVSVREIRDQRTFSTKAPYTPKSPAARENLACRRALAMVPPSTVSDSRTGANLLDQRSSTVDNPADRKIFPVIPNEPTFAPYRARAYFASVTLTGVHLAERTATLQVAIRPFGVRGKDQPRAFPRGTRLALAIAGASGTADFPIASPLADGSSANIEVGAPLSGSTGAYPQDTYFAALGPAKIRAEIPGLGDSYYAIDLDHAARNAGVAPELRAKQIPGVSIRFPNDIGCTARFGFVVERSAGRLFVWLMAFVPVLLLLLVVHSLRQHWRATALSRPTTSDQSLFGAAAATQAAVAFLAILSLRAVLVPSEITSVTRVDYLLAAELALLVLCLAVGALGGATRSRETAPRVQ